MTQIDLYHHHFQPEQAPPLPCQTVALPLKTASADAIHWHQPLAEIPPVLAECYRVLKTGGVIYISTQLASEQPKVARYSALFEQLLWGELRPHYSLPDWQLWLEMAGFGAIETQQRQVRYNLNEQMDMQGSDPATRARLAALLLHAPSAVREWHTIEIKNYPTGGIWYQMTQATWFARKT